MTTPIEIEYKLTKRIRQGKATMNKDFATLANSINSNYNVQTLNIIYDIINSIPIPRLQVIFEFEKEAEIFRTDFGFDQTKQKWITEKFTELLLNQKIGAKRTIWNLFKKTKYKTKNIYISFGAFETAAKIEANWSITETEIRELELDINLPDLWKIYPEMFDSPTYFFNTENDLTKYSENEIKNNLTTKYFELLKKYDEFNYIHKDNFEIKFDSKENFEKNYQGSWFNYDRR